MFQEHVSISTFQYAVTTHCYTRDNSPRTLFDGGAKGLFKHLRIRLGGLHCEGVER